MESKLEPVKTRVPYQLTLVLSEEEIRGLVRFLSIIRNTDKERIKNIYDISDQEVDFAFRTQDKLHNTCVDAIYSIDSTN